MTHGAFDLQQRMPHGCGVTADMSARGMIRPTMLLESSASRSGSVFELMNGSGQRVARRAFALFDRYYLVPMAALSLLVLFLNYHAQGMQGIVPHYEDFKRIILAGFDPRAAVHGTPTFPMWGYGWLLLLTENKTILLLLQNGLAFWAVWAFIRNLEGSAWFPASATVLLKFLLTVSVPWYAFHSLRWPYSVAVSLFLLSFILFVNAIPSPEAQCKRLALSGFLFGLVLNFRSDYIWLPLFLAAIVFTWGGKSRVLPGKIVVWVLAGYFTLLPWALYAKRATGHYLLTSTNAGHVLFIGLGNLPNNKWRIVPFDGDPVMHTLIREHFGEQKSSLLYETDRFLKREFLRRMSEDPAEYGRKVLHTFRLMLVSGVYAGEFFERPECHPTCFIKYMRLLRQVKTDPLTALRTDSLQVARAVLHVYSGNVGKYVVLVSFLLLPLVAILSWRQHNLLLLLVLGGILYQAAVNVFTYRMATYTSNMYFFHLVNISFGTVWIGRLLARQWKASDGHLFGLARQAK